MKSLLAVSEWDEYRMLLEEHLAEYQAMLESTGDWPSTCRIQGVIEGLRISLAAPQRWVDEADVVKMELEANA